MLPVLTSEAKASLGGAIAALVEAELQLSHADICSSLKDALCDMYPGQYVYVENVFGDDESGDVIYCCGSDTYKAPYEIGLQDGKRTTAIDTDQAVNVLRRVVYDEEADEDDHYASMSDADVDEAVKSGELVARFPGSEKWDAKIWRISERFISKKERDAADSSDFAGKGRSYPILKPSDVMAAVRSMGRAGSDNKSMSALKASIIRIAKRKGWTKYLPKSWQSGDSSESAPAVNAGTMLLRESAETLEAIVLREAKADWPIKLIAPGKGSSAFYPAEVLKRDGPKVFGAGTHVYLNHPTAAEEAARPEGDVKNLAGVLTTTAKYEENGSKGPGLYARMKVFADHAQTVEEKAPHVGMSIRASGIAESGKSKDGLPILKELVSAESVDVVTRAGAGGMILTESAATAAITTQEGDTMTPEEIKKLVEAGVAEANRPLVERLLKADAEKEARRLLAAVTLPDPAKERVIERCVAALPMKEGKVDNDAFHKLIVTEAKAEGSYLAQITGRGNVVGMGTLSVTESSEGLSKKERKALKEAKRAEKDKRKDAVDVFESLMGDRKAAKLAVMKGVA